MENKEGNQEIEKIAAQAQENIGQPTKGFARAKKNLEAKFKKPVLFLIDEGNGLKIDRIPTGMKALDRILDGGIPRGRYTQIMGPHKTGKTSLTYNIIAECHKQHPDNLCVFIDAEKTYDTERAKLAGCDLNRLYISQPDNAEEVFEILHEIVPTGVPLIIVDSIVALYPEKVMDNDIGAIDVAPIARFLTIELPKLNNKIHKYNNAVVFINQVRDKVGFVGFGDTTHTPGGNQLKHLSSLIIKMQKRGSIKVSDDILGQEVKVRIDASKVCTPFKECILNLIFVRGYVEPENLEKVKREVRKSNIANDKEFNAGIEVEDE